MKGLELSEAFYQEFGEPMLRESFPDLLSQMAVGLWGCGSECLGYDDTISQDHDFEPGFCILLPSEERVDRRRAFALERAYAKLPMTYMGYERSRLSPVGGNRHGLIWMDAFLMEKIGLPTAALSPRDWFYIPEQSLLEVVNGRLFFDGSGDFTAVRERLSYLPEDIRRKKLAGHLLLLGQAGRYNYPRCLDRGETGGARLALGEFVKSAIASIFLLNRAYLPYYKWQFRALRALPRLSEWEKPLERLLSGDGDRREEVEVILKAVLDEVKAQGLSRYEGEETEGYAHTVNDGIGDSRIRNLHILYGVN